MTDHRFPRFDTTELLIKPLRDRVSDLDRATLYRKPKPVTNPQIQAVGNRMRIAKQHGKPVIAFIGGHVIKQGCSLLLCDLIREGFVTHVAGNGAVAIHDWELSLIGKTSENVGRYIQSGEFGMWADTGAMNSVVTQFAMRNDCGLGEAYGRAIAKDHVYADDSVMACCHRNGVACTIHPGIGYDITNAHPNFPAGCYGAAANEDFLIFTHAISQLEGGGVFLNIGTAVAGPEVYLKALSAARNVALQNSLNITKFSTAVFDIYPLGDRRKAPDKSEPAYYFRPLKTILDRTVADGGESFYVEGDHSDTIPQLHAAIIEAPNV
jgi:hypothetical protein